MIKQAIVSTLLSAGVSASNKIAHTADGRLSKAPKVNSYDCQRGCIFENDDDYWCFLTSPPALRIGWEWEQFYGQTSIAEDPVLDYYQLKFMPYFQAQAEIESNLNLDNMLFTQFTVAFDQFKMNYFFSVIINSEMEACFGLGWDSQTISIALNLQYQFINCVKKIFEKLCDLSENWRGADAKWFDECEQSDTAQLDLWEYDIQLAETDQILLGTVDPKSEIHCNGVFGIDTSSSP